MQYGASKKRDVKDVVVVAEKSQSRSSMMPKKSLTEGEKNKHLQSANIVLHSAPIVDLLRTYCKYEGLERVTIEKPAKVIVQDTIEHYVKKIILAAGIGLQRIANKTLSYDDINNALKIQKIVTDGRNDFELIPWEKHIREESKARFTDKKIQRLVACVGPWRTNPESRDLIRRIIESLIKKISIVCKANMMANKAKTLNKIIAVKAASKLGILVAGLNGAI